MRLPRDQTVRRVVVSLLVAIVLLIPLSVALNRLSLGATQGLNLAEVFAYSRGLHAQEPAAAVPSIGALHSSSGEEKPEGDDSSSKDFDTRNSSEIVTSSGNEAVALEGSGDEGSDSVESDDDPATSPPVLSPEDEEKEDAIPVVFVSSTSGIPDATPVNRSEARRQRVFQPASLPHYSFVKFSAYRQSLHTFFVTGISSYVARTFDKDKIAHTCEWHPAVGRKGKEAFVETEAHMLYMKTDDNYGTYSPTIINCTFSAEVGADRKGGLLVLRISTGYNRWAPNLPVVAMEELPGEVDVVMTPPEKVSSLSTILDRQILPVKSLTLRCSLLVCSFRSSMRSVALPCTARWARTGYCSG
jgi:hypothetical protein